MPFLLDMTLGNVFTRNSRTHAFYNLICWQSILGHDFSEDKMKTFLQRGEYMAPHEKTWTPLDAQAAFAKTVDTWIFSTRDYMNEVLEKMVEVSDFALQKGAEIAATIEKGGMSGATNEFEKNTQTFLAELHQCINSDYINSTAKDASFRTFDEFKMWSRRFRKENLEWEHDDPEKFDRQLTQQVFGFSLDTCTDSLCEILLRQGRGFVNAAYRMGNLYVPIAKQAGEICKKRDGELFGWSSVFETLRNWDKHLVGQSDRMTYFHPSDFSAGGDYLIKIVNLQKQGRVNFSGFCEGLWLSGYQPAAIEKTLEVMAATLKETGASGKFEYYLPRLSRPDFVHQNEDKTYVISGFAKKTHIGLIPRVNWDELVRFTNESIRGASDDTKEPERELVEESQVVSDKHAQPKGIAPDETKAEVEKKENGGESSMMPVAAFAAVIVGVLIFAR